MWSGDEITLPRVVDERLRELPELRVGEIRIVAIRNLRHIDLRFVVKSEVYLLSRHPRLCLRGGLVHVVAPLLLVADHPPISRPDQGLDPFVKIRSDP